MIRIESLLTIDVSEPRGGVVDFAEYVAERSCAVQLPHSVVQTHKWPTRVALYLLRIFNWICYNWLSDF